MINKQWKLFQNNSSAQSLQVYLDMVGIYLFFSTLQVEIWVMPQFLPGAMLHCQNIRIPAVLTEAFYVMPK